MQGESEEMMETLRAAGLATTENAENMLYMTNVLTKKTKLKYVAICGKMDFIITWLIHKHCN